jgi:hypothetical protein
VCSSDAGNTPGDYPPIGKRPSPIGKRAAAPSAPSAPSPIIRSIQSKR